ncbi:MAG: hypothetical protein ACOCUU_02165 [Nanoarchaeota archaeon]
MKTKEVKFSKSLFKIKLQIEKELSKGDKTNEDLYKLISKANDFLIHGRIGIPVSKKLPLFKYYNDKFGVTNLFLIKISKEGRAVYTNVSGGESKILQIILQVHKNHKDYEKVGGYE